MSSLVQLVLLYETPEGEFVAAANDVLELVSDVVMAEAAAVQLGLEFAAGMGCPRIVLQSDNSSVVEILHRGEKCYGPAMVIFEDCFYLLKDFSSGTQMKSLMN